MEKQAELAWNLLVELRKEIISMQQIRARIIGFKIAFISSGVGLIVANLKSVRIELLAIPALAAIFFDLLVNSYSVSIKRKGYYCRAYLEPKLRKYSNWPKNEHLWEEFMSLPREKKLLSLVGNIGITTLALLPAIIVLVTPFRLWLSAPLLVVLIAFFLIDVISHLMPKWISERKIDTSSE